MDRVRLSPSGPFIGTPPLRNGAGTEGVRWRLHGTPGAGVTAPPAVYTVIPGMGNVTVDMQPGYFYQLKSYIETQTSNLTVGTGGFSVYFRTRADAAHGSAWSSWTALSSAVHEIPLTATPLNATAGFQDCANGVQVLVPSDRLEVAVLGTANNGIEVLALPGLSFCDVSEYVG